MSIRLRTSACCKSPRLRIALGVATFAVLVRILVGCRLYLPSLESHVVASCTNSVLRFQLTVTNSPPYYFVLASPPGAQAGLDFRGEIKISQNAEAVAAFPIDSSNTVGCNWLSRFGLDGHILTWWMTNRGERLSDLLIKGQAYEVEVRFSKMPPLSNSLWFESRTKGRWTFRRERDSPHD